MANPSRFRFLVTVTCWPLLAILIALLTVPAIASDYSEATQCKLTLPIRVFVETEIQFLSVGEPTIIDVRIEYPQDFTEQMLEYADRYAYLPAWNF